MHSRATLRSRAAAVAAVLLLVGCQADAPAPEPQAPTTPEPVPSATTLEDYGTDGVAVSRSPFCDRVSPTGIERALDAMPRRHRDYGNGDPVRLLDGSRSISHEYGCAWTAAGGTTARAWVFVPPISRGRAGRLVEDAVAGRCSRIGAGEFGTPSVTTRCRTPDGVEVSWRGLFGDAWLTCSLTAARPATGLEQRLGAWCVSVLDAARV